MNPIPFCLLLSLAAALLVAVSPRRFKPHLLVVSMLVNFSAALYFVGGLTRQVNYTFQLEFNRWLCLSFAVEGLNTFVFTVFSFTALLISIYCLGQEAWEKNHFCASVANLSFMVMAALFSTNLIFMFLFFEGACFCAFILNGLYSSSGDLKFRIKNIALSSLATLVLIFGIVNIYLNNNTLQLDFLIAKPMPGLLALFFLSAVLLKSAQALHLASKAGTAASCAPQAAVLNIALMTSLAFFIVARVLVLVFSQGQLFFDSLRAVSMCFIFSAAAFALLGSDIRNIIGSCALSQFGFILLCLAGARELSLRTAMVCMFANALAVTGLFLCADRIVQRTGKFSLREIGGLAKFMPYTATAFILCAFSLIGIPPFLGFWPKCLNVLSSVQQGHVFIEVMAVVGAFVTLFYLMRLFNKVFLGKVSACIWQDRPAPSDIVVLFIGALSLLSGLLPGWTYGFLRVFIK